VSPPQIAVCVVVVFVMLAEVAVLYTWWMLYRKGVDQCRK
jgi:hypothetical protein